jgi:hypothetical protein
LHILSYRAERFKLLLLSFRFRLPLSVSEKPPAEQVLSARDAGRFV